MAFFAHIGSWLWNLVSCGKPAATVAPIQSESKMSDAEKRTWQEKDWGAPQPEPQPVGRPVLDVVRLDEENPNQMRG